MNSIWNNFDSRARRLGILEVKLAQVAAMGVALTIAKLYPPLMDLCVWWFVGLAVVCAVQPWRVFFGKEPV